LMLSASLILRTGGKVIASRRISIKEEGTYTINPIFDPIWISQVIDSHVNTSLDIIQAEMEIKIFDEEKRTLYKDYDRVRIAPPFTIPEQISSLDFIDLLPALTIPQSYEICYLARRAQELANYSQNPVDILKAIYEILHLMHINCTSSLPDYFDIDGLRLVKIMPPNILLDIKQGNPFEIALLITSILETTGIRPYIIALHPSRSSRAINARILVGIQLSEHNAFLIDVLSLGHRNFDYAYEVAREEYMKYAYSYPDLIKIVDIRARREEGLRPTIAPKLPHNTFNKVRREIDLAINRIKFQRFLAQIIPLALIGITIIGVGALIASSLTSSPAKDKEEKV